MEIQRYRQITAVLFIFYVNSCSEKIDTKNKNAPYKLIDVFKVNRTKSDVQNKESEQLKLFLDSIAQISTKKSEEDLQISAIIASINKIKNNLTAENILSNSEKDNLNEAIILDIPENNITKKYVKNETGIKETQHKNVFEDHFAKLKTQAVDIIHFNNTVEDIKNNYDKYSNQTTNGTNTTYVEIMTIEPDNSSKHNTTSHNIIEILKHLMPMFNSTLTKELHNITIIERDHNRNHSFSEVKNISTIIVTYCDKENFTKANETFDLGSETDIKIPVNVTKHNDFMTEMPNDDDYDYDDIKSEEYLTVEEKNDIMEAADYGMKKMHELYSITEPKLYSMGLWLDDMNPARYVAAFNAPAEEAARYSRYGYASLQAATRLKQLTRVLSIHSDGVNIVFQLNGFVIH